LINIALGTLLRGNLQRLASHPRCMAISDNKSHGDWMPQLRF